MNIEHKAHKQPPQAPNVTDYAEINGVRVPLDLSGVNNTFVSIHDFTLPSGKKACIREGVGDDLLDIQEMADVAAKMSSGKYSSEKLFQYAMLASLVRIDGAPVTIEELRRMNMWDVAAMIKEVGESQQGFLSRES
jgi:hypothetical protein